MLLLQILILHAFAHEQGDLQYEAEVGRHEEEVGGCSDQMGIAICSTWASFCENPDMAHVKTMCAKTCGVCHPHGECTGAFERWTDIKKNTHYNKKKVSPLIGSICTSDCYESKGWWGDSYCYVAGGNWGADCGAKFCGSCDHERGVVYDGDTLSAHNANSAEVCQKKCTHDATCNYWTMVTDTKIGNCLFKASIGGRSKFGDATSGGQCKWMDGNYAIPPTGTEEALADEFEVALPAQVDSPQVVLHAFAALGVAVLAYGAFKYYTKKNADYQEVEV